jgi:hypothetical protein
LYAFGLRQLPGQCVFAATRAYNKNFHESFRSGYRFGIAFAGSSESKYSSIKPRNDHAALPTSVA